MCRALSDARSLGLVPDTLRRASWDPDGFADGLDTWLPYGLQKRDFQNAMDALYDFFLVVNGALAARGLPWFEESIRAAAVSNVVSDLVHAAVAKYSNGLVRNQHHNGHPDLIPRGMYDNDDVLSGDEGIEVKSTRGRVADTHGARHGWVCQFNYIVDSEPVIARRQPTFVSHIYLARVSEELFRRNLRKTEVGTNTSTLDKSGLAVLRAGVVYVDPAFTQRVTDRRAAAAAARKAAAARRAAARRSSST